MRVFRRANVARRTTRFERLSQSGATMGLILLIVLILLLVGAFPTWGHSREWGYRPTGLLTVVIVVVLILVLAGYIPRTLSL